MNGWVVPVRGLRAGTAPSNSRVFRESPWGRVFVEPGCDDERAGDRGGDVSLSQCAGPAVGARSSEARATAYQGVPVSSEQIEAALAMGEGQDGFGHALPHGDAAAEEAADSAADRIDRLVRGRAQIEAASPGPSFHPGGPASGGQLGAGQYDQGAWKPGVRLPRQKGRFWRSMRPGGSGNAPRSVTVHAVHRDGSIQTEVRWR